MMRLMVFEVIDNLFGCGGMIPWTAERVLIIWTADQVMITCKVGLTAMMS